VSITDYQGDGNLYTVIISFKFKLDSKTNIALMLVSSLPFWLLLKQSHNLIVGLCKKELEVDTHQVDYRYQNESLGYDCNEA